MLKTYHRNKSTILYKLSTQKIFLNIGDLLRYKEHFTGQTNYNCNEAREFYYKAQKLIPENGVPYNQLAIIAINYNNIFDAIYYHMRSLSTSNPIYSAKESLKVLLDEIRKKYDDKFKQESDQCSSGAEIMMPPREPNEIINIRKEIWIHPNGSKKYLVNSDHEVKSNENLKTDLAIKHPEYINLSNNDLKKEFLSSYLYVIGKLFSGIGLENFPNTMFKMLHEFNICMLRFPGIFKNQRILEIMAINIFLFDYHNIEDTDIPDTVKEVQSYAFQVGLFMFGIIINRLNDILNQYFIERAENENTSVNFNSLPEEFNDLLKPIKIWCNWMSLNVKLCNRKSHLNDTNEITPWKSFAKLLTNLSRLVEMHKNHCEYYFENAENRISIISEENKHLYGFGPLKDIMGKSVYVEYGIDEHLAKLFYKIREIVDFAENCLCDGELTILSMSRTSTGDKIFTKNVMTKESADKLLTVNLNTDFQCSGFDGRQEMLPNELEDSEGDANDKTDNHINTTNIELNELRTKKNILEQSTKIQQIYKENLQDILEDSQNSTVLEIKPKYLVPDTNCFIDYLEELEQLLLSKNTGYNLMVPLVVVNELEGLSKGFKFDSNIMSCQLTNSRIHHFDEVARYSALALEFIQSKYKLNIKCCTTKGSILKNSSAFTLEEDDSIYSNDDKILTTAVSLAAENFIQTDCERSFIRTEVVLLTTDRNLRVKALAKNLAVTGLKEFLNWTQGEKF